MKRLLILLIALACAMEAQAANHYVRAGATGTASGNDWTNAYTAIPAALTRGDTYYVAAGSYGAVLFDDAPQTGGATISIVKATAANSGAVAGWSAAYAGQASFTSFDFDTSNYTIDGQFRNDADWFDRTGYGFVVGTGGSQTNQIDLLNCSAVFHNIVVRYTAVRGYDNFAGLSNTVDVGAYAIFSNSTGCTDQQYTGLRFSYVLAQGGVNQFLLRNSTGAIIEYSAGELTIGNGANHGDTINAYYSVQNMIVRYNKFRHLYTTACSGCGSTGWIPYCCGSGGLEVYGNWVSDFRAGDGAVGYSTCSPSNCPSNSKIYNNTFDSCNDGTGGDGGIQLGNGTNNVAYNNIWTGCTNISLNGVTHDYNSFGGGSAQGEAHGTINFPTSNFVNYAALDFRLSSATTAGTSLASPYNVDPLGSIRGSDGIWDRGAYEYPPPSSDITPPAAPTGLYISRRAP